MKSLLRCLYNAVQVNHRQAWVDGFLLTGMVLGGTAGRQTRVWRFTPSIRPDEDTGPNATRRFVTRTQPSLILQVYNDADDDSVTRISFHRTSAAAIVPSPTPRGGGPLPSRLGLWIVEANADAPLPSRSLCWCNGTCTMIVWPPHSY